MRGSMKALVAGWFSFKDGLSTAGDVRTGELVCRWLAQAGHACDLALAPPFVGGVDWTTADPTAYSHVVFVCGPFVQYPGELKFLERFASCRLVGLNLSMQVPLDAWNPFDVLFERDSSARARPDLTFGCHASRVPVVGVCLVEAYGYPD